MIVVDTSALVAIVLNEDRATDCQLALRDASQILISAGTLTEVFVVAARKNVMRQMNELLAIFAVDVISVTENSAKDAGAAYTRGERASTRRA